MGRPEGLPDPTEIGPAVGRSGYLARRSLTGGRGSACHPGHRRKNHHHADVCMCHCRNGLLPSLDEVKLDCDPEHTPRQPENHSRQGLWHVPSGRWSTVEVPPNRPLARVSPYGQRPPCIRSRSCKGQRDLDRDTLARIIRKGSDFGSQDGVIVSRTKDRTLPLSSAGHVGRKIGRMARCERPAGQLRRGRSREAR